MTTTISASPLSMSAAERKAQSSHVISAYAETISVQESFKLPSRQSAKGNVLMAASGVAGAREIDLSWLKAASEAYHISADLNDYVLAEVPIVEGDVPNRNMNCFLSSRLLEFLPEYGCQTFQTFIGKPTFLEHDHDDITKAKGVIFDSCVRVFEDRLFTFILKGFDRTKDAKLAQDVLTMRMAGHSMSAYTEFFDCAFCGRRYDTQWANACACQQGRPAIKGKLSGKGQIVEGKLVYDLPYRFKFFESSAVGDPANYAAWMTQQFPGSDLSR